MFVSTWTSWKICKKDNFIIFPEPTMLIKLTSFIYEIKAEY